MIDIYLYAYGNASNNADSRLGPAVLKQALQHTLYAKNLQFHPSYTIKNNRHQKAALPDVVTLCQSLANATQISVSQKRFFITLGGDNTSSIGSFSGAQHALAGNLGLIWFDAHMDSHTFDTTPSNNIHGMPLAALLGHGDPSLTQILSSAPKIKPEHVALIGVRSYENGEAALLKKLGVKIFDMPAIAQHGINTILENAVKIVTNGTAGFGLCIDLDGFDPKDAPGVGMPENNGVNAQTFLQAFPIIAHHPKLIGAEIVEFNPMRDHNHKTEQLAVSLCEILFHAHS